MNDIAPLAPLPPADFASDQEVRWCPGCGDYSILKAVQRVDSVYEAYRVLPGAAARV